MTATYTITKIAHVVEIATTLTGSWFRGHATVVNCLVPKVFRSPYSHEIYQAFRNNPELAFIEQFKRDAPTLASAHEIPRDDDNLGWFYLMQHYGTPTRLLDWTKSALVALWFAVNDQQEVNGEVWAMHPDPLNRLAGVGFGIPLLGRNPAMKFLSEQPYWRGTPEALAEEVGLEKPVNSPIAFEPQRRFPRMVAQSSTFTIHPKPNGDRTIPEILLTEKQLVRYIVPAKRKGRLYDDLKALGIKPSVLFPDFEGLARTLIDEARVIGYGPPLPPPCDGEYKG